MRILLATDTKVYVKDGRYYADNSFVPVVKRYFDAFQEIILCTRTVNVSEIPTFCAEISQYIYDYIAIDSLKSVLLNKYNQQIINAISNCDIVVSRVPSIVSYRVADIAIRQNKPYMTEAMGCAWDAYWNHGILGKSIALYMFLKMKKLVYRASYSTYVTEKFLQSRYPSKNNSINASNVSIGKLEDRVLKKRINKIKKRDSSKLVLLTAAAVNVRYKGHEYVIRAIKSLCDSGIDITYYLAGKGDQTFLRNLSKKYQVEDRVIFLGGLSRQDVINAMDMADIYIQPSKQEGLPRSIIEAMSRGCPVLGANTAGIPELIQNECVFKRGSVSSVISSIKMILNEDLERIAIENFSKAKEYEEEILDNRRQLYYEKIKRELLEKSI
ncbi:glycosyltransferase [Bacillus sp. AFS077874]|uniref:glycosyltransferase n=1 Tax=Bacillus sp. AFS077874 TaxID=2033513 RepID=UPI001596E446|nr:glycosyltransferase [Bacillus sp. AFS077874]